MPGFDVTVSGAEVAPWECPVPQLSYLTSDGRLLDPIDPENVPDDFWMTDTERAGFKYILNQPLGQPALRYATTVGSTVVLTATLEGQVAPLDTALAGRLFTAVVIEAPLASGGPTGAAGQSSVQNYIPMKTGHYLLRMTRARSGSWYVPFDAHEPGATEKSELLAYLNAGGRMAAWPGR